jgi:predicted RNA-binding Zn-ribbon protein involved in translation (DUF1610 family)
VSKLVPLTCGSCRAPVPLGAGAEVTCPNCGASQALPEDYRALRDAHRLSESAERDLQKLSAELNRPPALWKRVFVIVGFVVGGVTVIVLALGALLGAIAGLLAGSKSGSKEGGMLVVYLFSGVAALVSVPFVGEYVVLSQTIHDYDLLMDTMLGRHSSALGLDLTIGAVLYLFGIVPIALAYNAKVKLDGLDALRAGMTAKPLLEGRAWGCRACGAPLDVGATSLGAKCVYCGTDSLVNVDAKTAAAKKRTASVMQESVQEAWASVQYARHEERQQMRTLLIYGPLLAPLVALGGVVMRAIAS